MGRKERDSLDSIPLDRLFKKIKNWDLDGDQYDELFGNSGEFDDSDEEDDSEDE